MEIAGFFHLGDKQQVSPTNTETIATQDKIKLVDNTKKLISNTVPVSSFKIRSSFKEINKTLNETLDQVSSETKDDEVLFSEIFDIKKIKQAINHYIQHTKVDATISTALISHEILLNGTNIKILVDNNLQLSKLEALHSHLRASLAKLLNNNTIELEFGIFKSEESSEEKKLFTSSEKLEHFIKLNPAVAELTKIFELEHF